MNPVNKNHKLIAQARSLHKEGKGVYEIAKLLNRNSGQVQSWITSTDLQIEGMGRERVTSGKLYSDEELREAVKTAVSYMQVARNLGVKNPQYACGHLKERIKRLGLDVSHFATTYRKYTREIFEEAVKKSVSYADVARALGLSPVGGNCCAIRENLAKFKIDTSHFTGQAHNRGRSARNKKDPSRLFVLSPPEVGRRHNGRVKKAFLGTLKEKKCSGCGIGEIANGKRLVLQMDHRDGNPCNNVLSNLRLLCPTCHTQTENFSRRKI